MIEQGVHPLIVMHAQIFSFRMFMDIYTLEHDWPFQLEVEENFELASWERLYRDQYRTERKYWLQQIKFSESLSEVRNQASEISLTSNVEFNEAFKAVQSLNDEKDPKFDLMAAWSLSMGEFLKNFDALEEAAETEFVVFDPLVDEFIYKVSKACLCICGKTPWRLYREACKGNIESILTLIGIDRQVQYFPKIAKTVSAWERQPRKHEALISELQRARMGEINQWKNAEHVKLGMMRFLSKGSSELDDLESRAFTKKDLRHLFDAWSRKIHGTAIDEDLPLSDEALAKAMPRKAVSEVSDEGWDIFMP
ncbi:hypothetical protein [uncultured Rubinisphaera sp.]|uniref:hypothetical protein n=1 Tax=uncultured Rubinisphaera sp. TaxID=1678686 RepID=UPI0030DCABA8